MESFSCELSPPPPSPALTLGLARGGGGGGRALAGKEDINFGGAGGGRALRKLGFGRRDLWGIHPDERSKRFLLEELHSSLIRWRAVSMQSAMLARKRRSSQVWV